MSKLPFLLAVSALCFAPGIVRADPVNEPPVPAQPTPRPIDTTPAWLTQMSAPPAYINTQQNAPAPVQPVGAVVQQGSPPPAAANKEYVPVTVPSYVEAGVDYYNVNNNYGNTFGQFVNVQYQGDPWNRWLAGVEHAESFHDSGEAFSVGNIHTFNQDWFSQVDFGEGSGASFLTRFRVDAAINRTWLDGHNLITTLGYTWDQANETYTDNTVHLGVTYYFPAPWVIQAGVNLNDSSPGSVLAPSAFVALTQGYQGRYFITGKVTVAREAYQLLGDTTISTAFDSETYDLIWRQWVGEDWGFNLGGEYYTNPYYDRTGGLVSVFKEF